MFLCESGLKFVLIGLGLLIYGVAQYDTSKAKRS